MENARLFVGVVKTENAPSLLYMESNQSDWGHMKAAVLCLQSVVMFFPVFVLVLNPRLK